MPVSELTHNDSVRMAIDAGVAPIELRYIPIITCDTGKPIAYLTRALVHSTVLGNLNESDYLYVSDNLDCSVTLLQHNLQRVIYGISELVRAESEILFVALHCPDALVETADLYTILKEMLDKYPAVDPHMICLVFSTSLLRRDPEKAKQAIMDLKVLKVRTAITDCCDDKFIPAKLLQVSPDVAFLSPTATAWAGSRDKPLLLPSLVSYVKSMCPEVVAVGTPEQRKSMRSSECIGFLELDAPELLLKEAVAQKEDDA